MKRPGKVLLSKAISAEFTEGKRKYKLVATAELHDLGQAPYFAITGDVYRVYPSGGVQLESCGCQHDLVSKYIPELAPFIRWHLTNIVSGPMHYIANGLYWAGFTKWTAANWDHFNGTVVWGAVGTDALAEPSTLTKEELTDYLNLRFADLMNAFDADMVRLFGFDQYSKVRANYSPELQ